VLLDIERVAHGGVCVGHAPDGRVVFVRHTAPGERVRVEVTEERRSYLRADAVEIVQSSPSRVEPPCPWAGPGRCGGCDWQHLALDEQRRLKAQVVREQLERMAGIVRDVVVEPVPGDADGLGWRTRVRFAVDENGRAGLRRHRSHEIEPIGDCLIAHPRIEAAEVVAADWSGHDEVEVAVASTGERLVTPPGGGSAARDLTLREEVDSTSWQLPAGGFWQVHPGAAGTLREIVDDFTSVQAGERCLDLYAGVGIFADVLSRRAGARMVTAVESERRAVAAGAAALPDVHFVGARVEPWLRSHRDPVDVVVLDPPRKGAGKNVMASIAGCSPRVVAYVACDPAALARDLGIAAEHGYELTDLRALDLFPMTAHVECVARLERA
jgi:tRNA/tmRNA/rRNA uracil-C5-methylase (TrmA/RlmC/RlmD family)